MRFSDLFHCRPIKVPEFKLPQFRRDLIWREFLQARLPIFWITGPAQSGKTTLAHFLSESSNYRLVHIKHLSSVQVKKSKATAIYMDLIKKEIKSTFKFCPGYILDDFPTNMRECKKFERSLCTPTIIIYISISLDATLGRALAQHPAIDLNAVRIDYVKQSRFSEKLYRRYEKSHKVIKIYSQYPIQDTHAKALEILETEFSYKFKQLTKPAG